MTEASMGLINSESIVIPKEHWNMFKMSITSLSAIIDFASEKSDHLTSIQEALAKKDMNNDLTLSPDEVQVCLEITNRARYALDQHHKALMIILKIE